MKFKGKNDQLIMSLRWSLLGISVVTSVGVLGYYYIEEWTWIDSFYMTIITISTVGLNSPLPLSAEGKIFTVLIIFFGVGIMAYFLSRLVEFWFQRSLANVLGRRSMIKKISKLKNHSIICGYGRTGRCVVEELQVTNTPYVVIEKDPAIIQILIDKSIPHIEGNATNEEILEKAGILQADSLVACLNSDPENLYLTLTSSGLAPFLRIIARIHDSESSRKFLKAGACRVVSPVSTGAGQIAQLITRPSVVDLIELVSQNKNIALEVFEYPIDEKNKMLNKTIAEARVRQVLGGMVIAVKHSDGSTTFDPGPEKILKLNDSLVAIRRPEEENKR